MDGYVRVSRVAGREGDSYISPTVQREAIAKWASYRGVMIAAWHVDEDWSGGTHERPGLEAAVERAVSGEVDGIVSWKIDRFSRYTEGGLRDLRRLEEAGAHLAFVSEDIDTSGPMGKFVYTIMLAMAEYFLANVREAWATAKARAHKRGAKIGPTPFAYRRAADGLLEVQPEEAAILQEAYARAATDGVGAAVSYLREVAPDTRTWTTLTVRRLLANRTYLGELRHGTLAPEVFENLRVRLAGRLGGRPDGARGPTRCGASLPPVRSGRLRAMRSGTRRRHRRQRPADLPLPCLAHLLPGRSVPRADNRDGCAPRGLGSGRAVERVLRRDGPASGPDGGPGSARGSAGGGRA